MFARFFIKIWFLYKLITKRTLHNQSNSNEAQYTNGPSTGWKKNEKKHDKTHYKLQDKCTPYITSDLLICFGMINSSCISSGSRGDKLIWWCHNNRYNVTIDWYLLQLVILILHNDHLNLMAPFKQSKWQNRQHQEPQF